MTVKIKAKIKIDDDIVYKGSCSRFEDLEGTLKDLRIKYEGMKKRRGKF